MLRHRSFAHGHRSRSTPSHLLGSRSGYARHPHSPPRDEQEDAMKAQVTVSRRSTLLGATALALLVAFAASPVAAQTPSVLTPTDRTVLPIPEPDNPHS